MKWLIPALPNAQAMNLNISLEVKEETIGFLTNEADAAIRFGPGPYPGLHSSHLAHCWIQPVASPLYLGDRTSDESLFTDPETTFLADPRGEMDNTDFSWNYYFSNTGVLIDDFNSDYQFERADLMLQAVVGAWV
jgi:LysR family glycine cleavage system transcriptional activator